MVFRRLLDELRAALALAPARPAWAAGLRAAIATVLPLTAAYVSGLGGAGTWMSLAGFSGALADRGGPYRARGGTIGAVTLACAAAVVLGTLAGAHPTAAIPVTLLVAVACSLSRAYGNAGISVGGSALVTFVIALAFPSAAPGVAFIRAGYVGAGGLWAMLVALVLWPLQPYLPVRRTVANAYRALADYAGDLEGSNSAGAAAPRAAAVRGALEAARADLATLRRGRSGETGRGERLLVLDEIADQLFGHLIGLRDIVETIPPGPGAAGAHALLVDALASFAATARAIGDGIEAQSNLPPAVITWRGDALRAELAASDDSTAPDSEMAADYREAAALLDRLAQYAGVAVAPAAAVHGGAAVPVLERPREVEDPEPRPPLLAPLRAALRPESLILRYALRAGLVTAAAVALTAALGLERGYWLTLTAVIVLQPYAGLTSRRALQRVLGTIAGGALTAGLAALFHDMAAILALAFVFAALSVALLPLNYAVFSVFLTPTFVLLAEASAGQWNLAGLRILHTVLGGALALAGTRLLWPSPEAERLPGSLASALGAVRRYLQRVVALFGDRSPDASRALRAARRDAGLGILNAEESFQRLLAEHRGAPGELEPVMALLTYARRVTASAAALALSRYSAAKVPPETLAPFGRAADAMLDDLVASVAEGRAPLPWTPLPEPGERADGVPPLLRGRLSRLERQLHTLHDAVERWERP
jgi:uncharacterized membrane protein YccC